MKHSYLHELGIVCALGAGRDQVLRAMLAGDQSGMIRTDAFSPDAPCFVGRVDAPLPTLPQSFGRYECRNNRLLLAALDQIDATVRDAVATFGPDRVGVVIGTSTSGILEGEETVAHRVRTGEPLATYDYQQQRLSSGSDFLSNYLGARGPSVSISTACSSSANAFAYARRMLKHDVCDAGSSAAPTACRA